MSMKTVTATVYGKEYLLACDAGQEEHLEKLVGEVNRRIEQLTQEVGRLQEPTMLLYAALMLADELLDGKRKNAEQESEIERIKALAEFGDEARVAALEEGMAESLHALANRIEVIADKLSA